MKDKFFAPVNLMQIEDALKGRKPYAVLVVVTTGLDGKEFNNHFPIRVCLTQFEFDNETHSYKPNIQFDKLIQAPQNAIDEAVKNADNYDIFVKGGVNKESYLKGENVLSPEDFKKEFELVMSAMKETGTTLILNGGNHFVEPYLDKVGCGDFIRDLTQAGKVLDQTRITQEYFQKIGHKEKATLENLRNIMAPVATGSIYREQNPIELQKKIIALETMTKEEFLKAYPSISERSYEISLREHEKRKNKIIGAENRIKVINNFITKYGIDEKILEPEWKVAVMEEQKDYSEYLSQKGKDKYKDSDILNKFNTLIEQGKLNPDAIMNGNSEYHKLMDVVVGKVPNKGIIIMHAASTGFEQGSIPQNTGFPIQFSAAAYTRDENGVIDFTKNKGVKLNIQAPSRSILKAEQNMKQGIFDAFKDANINYEDYKAGINVYSQESAVKRINEFFKKYPIENYTLVAIGGTRGTTQSFTQVCMSNLANFPMCEAPYIDFAKVIKEYSYLVCMDDRYPTNVLFDEDKMQGKTFSLKDVAEANGIDDLNGTAGKCVFVARLINELATQYIELTKDNILEKSSEQAVSKDNTPQATAEYSGKTEDAGKVVEVPRNSKFNSFRRIDNVRPPVGEGNARPVGLTPVPRIVDDNKEQDASNVVPVEDRKRFMRHVIRPDEHTIDRPADSSVRTRDRMVASQGVEHLDVSRLVEVIATLSEMISQQSKIIAEQNAKLMTILREQNQLMAAFLRQKGVDLDKEPLDREAVGFQGLKVR